MKHFRKHFKTDFNFRLLRFLSEIAAVVKQTLVGSNLHEDWRQALKRAVSGTGVWVFSVTVFTQEQAHEGGNIFFPE